MVIGACLVGLLGFVPGCDFINDLIGRGEEEAPPPPAADAGTAKAAPDAAIPPPPVTPPAATPDAAVATVTPPAPIIDGGVAKLPDGAVVQLPPGVDPNNLPPGFKLPPGVDPANLASGTQPAAPDAGTKVPDLTEGLPAGTDVPNQVDTAKLPPALALLPADVQAQLGKALAARKSLEAQIKRLNYVIDRNLTKDPTDIVKLNRMVRAKRELDSRLQQMAKQYNIPVEALQMQQ